MNDRHLFEAFFSTATAGGKPHGWQRELALSDHCESRLVRIPTGLGKTLGVLLAWAWHRVDRSQATWPRRLVWCLPMRVLVEQTEAEVRTALGHLGVVWHGGDHAGKVGVHVLMGGVDGGDWHLYPEHCAVLIGTQDMLLSRALNRGYGAARARWPMEFGLLNQDCLWVMDEVQLMDVGLATSGQLQAFDAMERAVGMGLRPRHTWWMSATLQRSWLEISPDSSPMAQKLKEAAVPLEDRLGPLLKGVRKPLRVLPAENASAIAELVAKEHLAAGRGGQGPTLAMVNTVNDALILHGRLARDKRLQGTDLRLVHSRFRAHERSGWRDAFLNRESCGPGTDRIIVATQVVEAGVDISGALLVTGIAPWASLVQRFGRAARWGGSAEIVVADTRPADDKSAAPYTKSELDAARAALGLLADVSPLQLDTFEESHPELLSALYPYAPRSLLLRHELRDLFDTTPDLSGADVDVSRFIRSGDERDLQVFWQRIPGGSRPDARLQPARAALCNVPFLAAREWLCGKESKASKAPYLKPGMWAWVWDWLDGDWRRAERRDLYPGQVVLVAADCGGYDPATGWRPESKTIVEPVPPPNVALEEIADAAQDGEASSAYFWQTIATHGLEVAGEVAAIAESVLPDRTMLLEIAGRWHDAGKAHVAFQGSIVGVGRPSRRDLAKAPREAWLPLRSLYPDENGRRRGGFRHELVTTLALFGVLRRHRPDHPALLGPWRELLEAAGMPPDLPEPPGVSPSPVEQEILALGPGDFDLLAFLVCSHHGKVRVAWHATPADQQAADTALRICGVRDGDSLPPVSLRCRDGALVELAETPLPLAAAGVGLNAVTGRGWTERVLRLLDEHGPFALAWMESLLRAADQRASRRALADPLLAASSIVAAAS